MEIDEKTRKQVTTENARKAGRAFRDKYGSEVYSEMGKKGAVARIAKYGPDYYKNIRAIGVAKQKAKKLKAIQQENLLKQAHELKAQTQKKSIFDSLRDLIK